MSYGSGLRGITAAAMLLLTSAGWAQERAFQEVDEYLKSEMEKQRIPGLAAAIVKDGRIVHIAALGLANVEHRVPVKPETMFQSGSMGKQFTAAAVMLLVQDGRMQLDDPIHKYLGEVPPQWRQITVRHLLTHTAGTTDYPPDFDFRRDYTEDELLQRAAAIPLAFQPGERWSYSNLGYVMLGALVSRVTGRFYGELLQERIFRPLGMETARVIAEADIVPNRAAGYRLVKGDLKNQEWVSPTLNTTADGSLYVSLYDMAKWDAALHGERLLKRTSLDEMWSAVKLKNGRTYPYGLGWMLRQVHGRRLVEHGGSWQGFKTYILRFLDEKLTVVLLANLAQVDPERVALGIAFRLDRSFVVESAQEKAQQTRNLVRDVLAGKTALDGNPELRARLREVREALGAIGAIESLAPNGRTEEDGIFSYRRYRILGKSGSRVCRVQVTSEGKIAWIELLPE